MNTNTKFEKTYLKNQLSINTIYTVHYFKYGTNFHFPQEKHNFWELIFIDSGTAKVVAEKDTISLVQGQAYLHKPNQLHTVYTEDKFANSAVVTFDCSNRALYGISDKVLQFSDYQKDLLTRILSETKAGYHDKLNEVFLTKMTKKTSRPFGNDQIIKNCLEMLMISLVRDSEDFTILPVESPMEAYSGDTVKNIITILKNKLDSAQQVSLDELSISLGFSKSYIKALFKKKTGKSVLQYFIQLKIERAKKLLSQQKYTITEIADMLGFNSVFYFSRQFKLHTDMSPSEYVNSIKADNLL